MNGSRKTQMTLSVLLMTILTLQLGLLGVAGAATYTESINGDLSGNRLDPTFLQLDFSPAGNVPGSNVITGTTGRINGAIDRDYLWVNVPVGFAMSELRVGTQTSVGGAGSFIGLAAGKVMPVTENATSAMFLLGWTLYNSANIGTDILDDMAIPADGSSGFSRPLPAGDYTFWIQELAGAQFNYRFNMVLTPIPLPAAAWLLGAGLLLLGAASRRRFADQAVTGTA